MKKFLSLIFAIIIINSISLANTVSQIVYTKNNDIAYTNNLYNYEIIIPNGMIIDEAFHNLYTRFYDDNTTIDILIDDFATKGSSYYSYITYGNKEIVTDKYHKVNYQRHIKIAGYNAYEMSYERVKLSKIENDKNYYYDLAINVNNKVTYTVIIKSTKPITNEQIKLAKSIKIKSSNIVRDYQLPKKMFKQITPKVNEETLNAYNKYFVDSKELTWGLFDVTTATHLNYIKSLEEKINSEFKFLIRYQHLGTPVPVNEIISSYKEGKILELSLQTMNTVKDEVDVYEILNGKYDEYFNQYAIDIKSTGVPVLFRLNNEMNGDWCGYCSMHFAKDAELYKETWKYIYKIFENNGVDNLLWVWNPNYKSFPRFTWNDQLMYYPGDEYVDIIGLTAYNTGNYYSAFGEVWTCFYDLYNDYYNYIDRLSEKPLMITEFACSSYGGNKTQWIINMFNHLYLYPNIKVAIWWNYEDYDVNGKSARTYRMDTTEILDVFKLYLGNNK